MKFVKKTKFLFTSPLLTLIGCGVVDSLDNRWITSNDIEPEFHSYVEEFKQNSQLGHTVKMIFGEIKEEDVIAYCYNYGNLRKNYILVDRTRYNELTDLEKEEVVYHELGHCILFRDHDETILNGNDYGLKYNLFKSIMYPYVFGGYKFKNHESYYHTELSNEATSLHNFL